MGTCELCGSDNVGLRRVSVHGSLVEACRRCTDRMGIKLEQRPPQAAARGPGAARPSGLSGTPKAARGRLAPTSGGYGGQGRAGRDIMIFGEKELADDFGKRIRIARECRGWDQRALARRLAEKVNIIQQAEHGKRPTDAVVKKLERELDIELMVDRKLDETSRVIDHQAPHERERDRRGARSTRASGGTGMTLGDFLNDL